MAMNPMMSSVEDVRYGNEILPLIEGLTITDDVISNVDISSDTNSTGSLISPVDCPNPIGRGDNN